MWLLTELDTPPSLMTVSTAVLPAAAALTPGPPSSPSLSLRFSGGAPEDEEPLESAGRFCPDILRLLQHTERQEITAKCDEKRGGPLKQVLWLNKRQS